MPKSESSVAESTGTQSNAPAKRRLRLVLGSVVLVAFVVLVQVYVGWGALLAPWLRLSPAAILLAVLLVFGSYWLRAMRIYDYFLVEVRGGFTAAFKLTLQHNMLNNLLPMRTGELSFPVLMAHYFKVPAVRSVPVLFWFRLLDLHTLLWVGLVAVGAAWWGRLTATVLILLWLPVPWLIYLSHNALAARLQGHPGRLAGKLAVMLASLPQTPRALGRAWAWTIINWVVKVGVFVWVLELFVDVSTAAATMGVISGELTSVLPVHGVAGIGTYEAGVVAGLMPFGVAPTEALQGAVNVHLFLLGSSVLGSVVGLMLRGGPPRG
jgi:uncharacterized membrane protein YbhN (UPF0104 family)